MTSCRRTACRRLCSREPDQREPDRPQAGQWRRPAPARSACSASARPARRGRHRARRAMRNIVVDIAGVPPDAVAAGAGGRLVALRSTGAGASARRAGREGLVTAIRAALPARVRDPPSSAAGTSAEIPYQHAELVNYARDPGPTVAGVSIACCPASAGAAGTGARASADGRSRLMGWRNTLPHDVAHRQPTDCADRESCPGRRRWLSTSALSSMMDGRPPETSAGRPGRAMPVLRDR